MENLASPFELTATRRFHRQSQPCKHCAALVRGRTSLNSRLRVRQFLETRIFPQWLECVQRVSVIGVPDGLSDGEGVVATFFLIKYQSIVASKREISLARQFSSVSLTNRIEINFARQFFGIGLSIIAVQQNFRDMLAKRSEANLKRVSIADSRHAICHRQLYFGAEEATSFWKRGSLRSGSNIGSSRSNAGVSGGFAARGAS